MCEMEALLMPFEMQLYVVDTPIYRNHQCSVHKIYQFFDNIDDSLLR